MYDLLLRSHWETSGGNVVGRQCVMAGVCQLRIPNDRHDVVSQFSLGDQRSFAIYRDLGTDVFGFYLESVNAANHHWAGRAVASRHCVLHGHDYVRVSDVDREYGIFSADSDQEPGSPNYSY